jgi:SAM-dependent methyltransferase
MNSMADVDSHSALRKGLLRTLGRDKLRTYLRWIGFDTTHWTRIAAYRQSRAWLDEIGITKLDALEIAPGDYWQALPFRSYRSVTFPGFDICRDVLPEQFDLVIADQVFEHVRKPWRAAQNVRAMLRPDGYFLILVPFLLKVHGYPEDCTRWTEQGLRWLLEDAGFDLNRIRSGTWGNRRCVIANFRHGWRMYGWGRSLRNNPALPVMTWALARA